MPVVQTKERSRSYPGLGLDEACEQVIALSEGDFPMNRAELTRALGYPASSGRGARAVSAVTAYGLLDRSAKQYTLSETGRQVRKYGPGNEMWGAAVRRAFKQPPLFADLLHHFGPQGSVPPLDDLAVVLVEHFEITEKASSMAARIFLQSGLFAQALARDGRILLGGPMLTAPPQAVRRVALGPVPPAAPLAPPQAPMRSTPAPQTTPHQVAQSADGAENPAEWKRAFQVELPTARLTLEVKDEHEAADVENLLRLFESFASR